MRIAPSTITMSGSWSSKWDRTQQTVFRHVNAGCSSVNGRTRAYEVVVQRGLGDAGLDGDGAEAGALSSRAYSIFVGGVGERTADVPTLGLGDRRSISANRASNRKAMRPMPTSTVLRTISATPGISSC